MESFTKIHISFQRNNSHSGFCSCYAIAGCFRPRFRGFVSIIEPQLMPNGQFRKRSSTYARSLLRQIISLWHNLRHDVPTSVKLFLFYSFPGHLSVTFGQFVLHCSRETLLILLTAMKLHMYALG